MCPEPDYIYEFRLVLWKDEADQLTEYAAKTGKTVSELLKSILSQHGVLSWQSKNDAKVAEAQSVRETPCFRASTVARPNTKQTSVHALTEPSNPNSITTRQVI